MDRSAFSVYDEGDVLFGAQRVLWGDVPYRDFWTLYGPAQYWTVALLFKLFGPTILIERLWDCAVRGAIATACYAFSREHAGRTTAVLTWAVALAWLWFVRFYGYPLLPSGLFGLLSAYVISRYAADPRKTSMLFWAGVFVGVAGAFRSDIGAFSSLAGVAAIMAVSPLVLPVREWRLHIRAIVIFLMGILAVAVPVIVYVLHEVPFSAWFDPLFAYPANFYVSMRSLPFPSLREPIVGLLSGTDFVDSSVALVQALSLYFPWCAVGVGTMYLWARKERGELDRLERHRDFVILALTLLVALFSLKTIVRPHVIHAVHAVVPAMALLAIVASSLAPGKWQRIVLAASVLAFAYPPLVALARDLNATFAAMRSWDAGGVDVDWARKVGSYLARPGNGPPPARYFEIRSDQAAAIAYINQHTAQTDDLFVANGRHDVTFINDVLFYFLAQRRSATKYHEFNPGLTTGASTQATIIREVQRANVPYVVRTRRFDAYKEPNKSAESSGVLALDHFLYTEFAQVERFGDYEIWRRLGLERTF